MNRFQQEYNDKCVTMEEALSHIKTGDCVVFSQCAIEPSTIEKNFHTVAKHAKDVTVFSGMCLSEFPYMCDPQYKDTFKIDDIFFMAGNRASHKLGLTSPLPGDLHNGIRRWMEFHKPTVFIGQATPMDDHGFFRMSLCLIHEKDAMEKADLVILEVNPNLPAVGGDTEVHISDVDWLVEGNAPVPELEKSQTSAIDMAIGENIASLVRDGDCIQLGIGSIPDAAAVALMGKHDLGVHTEMLTNSIVDLVNAGVITGKKLNRHKGKMVATFAYGNKSLYDMMDNNPSVQILRGADVTSPSVISQIDNFVSINTTMAVDLTGQCCSESIGSRHYSGTGGACDTATGAAHSKGGRAIIAVPSTKKNGTISSITAQLAPGSVVSVSRNLVDYVVTEYGVAQIRGMAVRERVENLINVAHPDYRAELRREAEKLMLW